MSDKLAINGGKPVRQSNLPYGRQWVDESDIAAVVKVLRSDWLTTGPTVASFENALCQTARTRHAVAVNSGTAALHCAMYALGISEGDEVIVPTITFAATANAALFQGGKPVFADVDKDTLLIDPASVEARITPRTKAVIAVDYAGQPCDYDALHDICARHKLALVADSCHAIGGKYKNKLVGQLAEMTCFSFHPVKHVTSGEGGAIATDNDGYAQRMRHFRNHNIATEFRQREQSGDWHYDVVDLGYNYRMPDIQSALVENQLTKLEGWVKIRRNIAHRYDQAFSALETVTPLTVNPDAFHAYHLYVIKLNLDKLKVDRGVIFRALRAEGIGVNVHYIPVHLHPLYRERLGTKEGLCPVAESAYQRILSLPLFPKMEEQDIQDVITAINKVTSAYSI